MNAIDRAIASMDARMGELQRRQRAAAKYDRHKAAILVCASFERLDEPGYLLDRLNAAVKAAERRAAAGHWSYDANHHLALLEARDGERRYQARSALHDTAAAFCGQRRSG